MTKLSDSEKVALTLETKGYIATEHDIEVITQDAMDATAQAQGVRQTYLRVLVASTKATLGMEERMRRGRVPLQLNEVEMKRQLEAMEATHERFYTIIQRTVEKVPLREDERGRERKAVYAARGTFARSSKSTLRAWISSGNSLESLVPSKVTKYALTAEVVKSRSPQQARAPSERYLHGVAAKILERVSAAKDQAAKIRLLETVLNDLVAGLTELGVATTTDLKEALRDHKLLETQTGVVWLGHRQAVEQRKAA